MPDSDQIIKEIQQLEQDFNSKLRELDDLLPKNIVTHVAHIHDPKFKGDRKKDFITIWAHNKTDSSRVF